MRGDVLAMLCAKALGARTVITPVSSNTVVEESGYFDRVERTRIGSPFVIKGMHNALAEGDRSVCGYEANGGFLLASDVQRGGQLLSALPTRDAVLPILAVLEAARVSSVRALVSSLPTRVTHSDRIPNFSPERRDQLMEWLLDSEGREDRLDSIFGSIAESSLSRVDTTDGVRMVFANRRVIHLRGSGNAPELRCYSEAEASALARTIGEQALSLVSKRF